jgi:tripartite-type tricarboxylate transporter receptor subunit TctC
MRIANPELKEYIDTLARQKNITGKTGEIGATEVRRTTDTGSTRHEHIADKGWGR